MSYYIANRWEVAKPVLGNTPTWNVLYKYKYFCFDKLTSYNYQFCLCLGPAGSSGQGVAAAAGACPLPAHRQVHPRQGNHRLKHLYRPGGRRGHGRRHQRRAGPKEGRRRLRHGHRRDGRGQGGLGHHPNRRQLHEHRESGHVGPERVRLHL